MNQRRHAAADGSFARSAGSAMGRAVAIVAIAVVVGLFLMSKALDEPSVAIDGGGGGGGGAQTTQPAQTTTTAATGSSVADTTTPAVQPTLRPPNQVTVLVANASGVDGAAGRMADTLNALGYIALKGNSPGQVTATAVYYADGFKAEAAAVALAVSANPAVSPLPVPATDLVKDLQGANVLIVLGPDLAKAA